MRKLLLFFPVLFGLLFWCSSSVRADEITTVFVNSAPYKAGMTLKCEEGGLTWTTSGKPNGFDAQNGRGIQFSKTSSEITTTVNGEVQKVTVVLSSNAPGNTAFVTVGGDQYGDLVEINMSNNDTYEFPLANSNSTGLVKVSLISAGDTGKSIYIKSIAITFIGEGSGVENGGNNEGGNDDTPDTPVTPDTNITHISIGEFLAKADTQTEYELTGKVTKIANATYGNLYLAENTDTIYVYGVLDKDGNSKKFESLGVSEGDELTVTGVYLEYNGTPEIKNAKFVKVVKGSGETPETPALKDPTNTEAEAYSVSQIVNMISSEEYDLTKKVYVKGKVVKTDSFNSKYGSITYWISEDGTENGQQFEIYGGLNFAGTQFQGQDDLQPGDDVVVLGKAKKYNEIFEMDKDNVLVSLNGSNSIAIVLAPTADVKEGSYLCENSLMINLSTASEDAIILYSLDGSDPNTDYTSPIVLTEGEYVLTARAMSVTGASSKPFTAKYVVSTTFPSEVTNGDMEAWTEGAPDGWTTFTTAGSATLKESSDACSGKAVIVGGKKGNNSRLASREMKVAAGWYTLSAYVKDATAGAKPAQSRLGYVSMTMSENGSYAAGSYKYFGEYVELDETQYTKLSCTFQIEEESVISVIVMNHYPDKDDVYDILVDDVEFRAATQDEIDATAVQGVKAEQNDAIYNLQGQRVNALQKGLYIQNGRVVVK